MTPTGFPRGNAPAITRRDALLAGAAATSVAVVDEVNAPAAGGASAAALPDPALTGVYNVKDPRFGARGDGVTDDTAAINAALQACNQTNGGMVYFPPGTYIVSGASSQFALAEFTYFVGAGRNAARVWWTTDVGGSGGAAIVTGPNPDGNSYSGVSDLTLIGPGVGAQTLGVPPCHTMGVELLDNGWISRCNLLGWYGAIAVVGNHQRVFHCKATASYFGLYWRNTATTFGNQAVMNTELTGNTMASIGVHGTNMIDRATLVDVHCGWSPFGIFKTRDGPYRAEIMTNTVAAPIWFEACGNGVIHADLGAGKGNGSIAYCHFHTFTSTGMLNGNWRIGSRAADWAVVVGDMQDNIFEGESNGFLPGAVGVFNLGPNGTSYNNRFPQADRYLSSMTGGRLLFNDAADVQGTDLWTRQGGRCSMRKVFGNVGLGDLVYLANGNTPVGLWSVARDTSSGASDVPAGLVQAWGLPSGGHWAPVLVEGVGPQPANTKSQLAQNAWIKADLANRGFVAAGSSQVDAPIIGKGQGIGASQAQVFVTLGG
jgi:hypothetical protein